MKRIVIVLGCLLLCAPEVGANGFFRSRSRVNVRVNVRSAAVVQRVNVVQQVRVQKVVEQVAVVKQVAVVQKAVIAPVFVPAAVVYPTAAYLSYSSLRGSSLGTGYDPCQATRERVQQLELQLRELQLRQQLQQSAPMAPAR